MKATLTIIFLILFALLNVKLRVNSQGLACLNTWNKRFVIFDNGKVIQQDYNPAQQFWAGHNYLAFIDYMRSLRVWYNGHAREVWRGACDVVSDDSMLVWHIAGALRCWKNDIIYKVADNATFYRISEGTIVYFDQTLRQLMLWYNGYTTLLDQNPVEMPFISLSISQNTVAWLTPQYQLNLYLDGQFRSFSFFDPNLQFQTASGMCLINNPNSNTLELISAENMATLDPQPAKWWKTSYQQVVYLNHQNDLITFNVVNNTLLRVGNQQPQILKFGNIGFFFEKNQQIFYFNGQHESPVIDYIPTAFYHFNNTFIYRNNTNQPEVWQNNQNYKTNIQPSARVDFMTNVIIVTEGNHHSFWFNNSSYEIE